jgi:hypothetical protein
VETAIRELDRAGPGPRWALGVLLLALAVRLPLLDRGALAYPDELRYPVNVLETAAALGRGDVERACFAMSTADGRPGYVLMHLPAAALQQVAQRLLGLPPDRPPSIWIPLAYQLGFSLLLLWVFWLLARSWLPDSGWLALSTTLAFALMASSNAYVRHVLPYDTALALLLSALWLATRVDPARPGRAEGIGALAGLGFATYPGYYLFPAIVLAVLGWRGLDSGAPRRSPLTVAAWPLRGALGGLVVALGFEIAARVGGRSYVADLSALGDTIVQGSFEEGFTFLVEYFWRVQPPGASAWLVLAAAAPLAAILRSHRRPAGLPRRPWVPVAAGVAVSFVVHALSSAWLEKMVFYGRLVHMYVPFVLLAGAATLALLVPPPRTRKAAGVVAIVSVVGFVFFFAAYRPLAYPRDVVREQLAALAAQPAASLRFVNESYADPSFGNFEAEIATGLRRALPGEPAARWTLVDFGFFYPLSAGDFRPYVPAPGEVEIFGGPHWLTHPVYMFEGNTIEERRLLDERAYRLRVYRTLVP